MFQSEKLLVCFVSCQVSLYCCFPMSSWLLAFQRGTPFAFICTGPLSSHRQPLPAQNATDFSNYLHTLPLPQYSVKIPSCPHLTAMIFFPTPPSDSLPPKRLGLQSPLVHPRSLPPLSALLPPLSALWLTGCQAMRNARTRL